MNKELFLFLFYILFSFPSFSQKTASWLYIEINCDTCTKEKCDTLIYSKFYDFLNCTVKKDTLLNSSRKKPFTPIHLENNLVLVETLTPSPPSFKDYEYFICSKVLVDSSKKYKIIDNNQHIHYEEFYQDSKKRIVKSYDKNQKLQSSDSTILFQKGKSKKSVFTSYYEDEIETQSKKRFQYYLNGNLKKISTLTESASSKFKRIYKFNSNGKLKSNASYKYEQVELDSKKYKWKLQDEFIHHIITPELTIEEYKNYINQSQSKVYLYEGDNYTKEIRKDSCFLEIKIFIQL